MLLDPSFDFVVFVRREIICVTENHITKCLVLGHGEGVSQLLADDGGIVDD